MPVYTRSLGIPIIKVTTKCSAVCADGDRYHSNAGQISQPPGEEGLGGTWYVHHWILRRAHLLFSGKF